MDMKIEMQHRSVIKFIARTWFGKHPCDADGHRVVCEYHREKNTALFPSLNLLSFFPSAKGNNRAETCKQVWAIVSSRSRLTCIHHIIDTASLLTDLHAQHHFYVMLYSGCTPTEVHAL